MLLALDQVTPDFIEKEKIEQSEVWGKKILVNKEETIQIAAPSGNGKTSLIHFIYGLRKDYAGEITYDKKSIRQFGIEEFSSYRQQKISIIFQDLRLFPKLTVRDNLELKRVLQPFHPASKLEEMAEQLGIRNKLEKNCGTCSFGEQQRVAIIRSLLQPFDILLLDEPFSHLDDPNREKATKLILRECAARKSTIVLTDLKALDFFPADRVLNL